MTKHILPTMEEVLFAITDLPLGEGAEAKVYKIHTNPKYTVRVSHMAPSLNILRQQLSETSFIKQPDIFEGRNFAQAIAYWGKDDTIPDCAMMTINLYCPGFSCEVYKPKRPKPDSEEALNNTKILTETMLNLSDKAIDALYDDMHFLSSRRYSLDVGGGLFCNTGNILYSAVDKRAFIIDLQPFITQRPGVPPNHTKGFNIPLYLTRGLLPGALCYAEEHSNDAELIKYRTQIVYNVICGAKRNHLNDIGGYLGEDAGKMAKFWEIQLTKLNISEKYKQSFIKDICSVKQENRYPLYSNISPFIRVAGKSLTS